MVLKLGENLRVMALTSGIAIAGVTAATAQDANKIVSGTTFSSLQEAKKAVGDDYVIAQAFNGETRIVSLELAELLDKQGFEKKNGILYGWTQSSFLASLEASLKGEGYNYNRENDYLNANSTPIKIEQEKSGGDKKETPDDGGGPIDA